MTYLRHLLLVVLVGSSATMRRAHAQNEPAAEAAFQEAYELKKQGKWAEACAKFALSQRLDPASGTLLNLADCQEHLGKTASAWASFTEARDLARRAGQPGRAKEAERRVKLLEPRLTRVRAVFGGDRPDGLVVSRDGQDITALIGTAVPIDPGEYQFEAGAPGFIPWSETVTIEGNGATIEVPIPPLTEDRESPPHVPEESGGRAEAALDVDLGSRTTSGMPRRRIVALGIAGGGVVSAGVGLVLRLRANSRVDSARELCGQELACREQADYDEAVALTREARTSGNIGHLLLGLGAATVATGAILWFTAPTSKPMTIQPQVGPDTVGFLATGRF